MLPTRGAFGPGLGPGPAGLGAAGAGAASLVVADAAGACSTGAAGAAGAGVGAAGAGAGAAAGVAGAAGAASTGACAAGASGSAGRGTGLGPGRGPPGFAAPGFAVLPAARSAAARPFGAAAAGADASAFSDGKDSRSRRATGASTVDDADLTNSPCSLSRASSSLLVTPSSFANSCTRALPATALLTERPSEAWCPHDLGLSPMDVHRWCFTVCSSVLLPVLVDGCCSCRVLGLQLFVLVEHGCHCGRFHISRYPKRTTEDSASFRIVQAFSAVVQPRTTTGHRMPDVGDESEFVRTSFSNHDPQQIGGRHSLPAPDACTNRPACHYRILAFMPLSEEVVTEPSTTLPLYCPELRIPALRAGRLGCRRITADVDAPTGQPSGQSSVLPFLPDGQR